MATNLTIKQLSESDVEQYKSIRLQSLADLPDAFGSTYEREAAFSEVQWTSRLTSSVDHVGSIALMASLNNNACGLVSGVISKAAPRDAHVYQMWVSPENRNAGIGFALLEQISYWAKGLGAKRLLLAVTCGNTNTVEFYTRYGFSETGIVEPLREGSSILAQNMCCSIR